MRRLTNIFFFLLFLTLLAFKQNDLTDLFDELLKKYPVKTEIIGKYKIEEITCTQTDTIPNHNSSTYYTIMETNNVYHRIGKAVYNSKLPTTFNKWSFLLPLKKVFLLPDSTLGIIKFSGGFSNERQGGAPNLHIAFTRCRRDYNYNLFQIEEQESSKAVMIWGLHSEETLNPDWIRINQSTIKNITWDNDTLSVIIRVQPVAQSEKELRTYKIWFDIDKLSNKTVAWIKKKK